MKYFELFHFACFILSVFPFSILEGDVADSEYRNGMISFRNGELCFSFIYLFVIWVGWENKYHHHLCALNVWLQFLPPVEVAQRLHSLGSCISLQKRYRAEQDLPCHIVQIIIMCNRKGNNVKDRVWAVIPLLTFGELVLTRSLWLGETN